MKKIIMSILIAITSIMFSPSIIFADDDSDNAILISTEQITLYKSGQQTSRVSESKEFTLKTYNDNGILIYSINVEDEEYRESAMDYINMLSGDSSFVIEPRAPLAPGDSEYHNDEQSHEDAVSYAWKRNTASTWYNNFEGGQATGWYGDGNCDYIVLNQTISIGGIFVSVSWPSSISGGSNSASWQSQPIYENVVGASFDGLQVGGTAFSCTFTECGDVYKGSKVYRPTTCIKFSYFS